MLSWPCIQSAGFITCVVFNLSWLYIRQPSRLIYSSLNDRSESSCIEFLMGNWKGNTRVIYLRGSGFKSHQRCAIFHFIKILIVTTTTVHSGKWVLMAFNVLTFTNKIHKLTALRNLHIILIRKLNKQVCLKFCESYQRLILSKLLVNHTEVCDKKQMYHLIP